MNDINELLKERGKRYGVFRNHAEIAIDLKRTVRHHILDRDARLQPDQLEALDMICHKIARLINGDPDHEDGWRDIAGYATLVADRLGQDSKADPF